MPVIAFRIEAFAAFSDSKIKVIPPCFSYIKKVSPAFPGPDAFTVNAFHFFVIVFVRHWYRILVLNDFTRVIRESKDRIVFQFTKLLEKR